MNKSEFMFYFIHFYQRNFKIDQKLFSPFFFLEMRIKILDIKIAYPTC